jgi:hypothetical protein
VADPDACHQAAELASALESVLLTLDGTGAEHVTAIHRAKDALARYRPDGPDLTVELQGAASLLLYRLNELPRRSLHPALVVAARNLRDKLTKLGDGY